MIRGKKKYLSFGILIFLFVGIINHFWVYKLELIGHYSKIGAHRVNSIEKLNSAVKCFEIIELDLEYNKVNNFMDVNHPPAESINLSIENYISVLDGNQRPFLWLDIKNLTKNNSTEILSKLLKTFKATNYPLDRVLVETQNPNTLPVFSDAGFKTSYYLPYGLCKMGVDELNNTIGSIKYVLNNNPDMAISSDIQDYQILDVKFPNKIKYTWVTGSVFRNNFFLAQKALRDPKVEIVLVTYNAPKGNR